MSKKGRWCMFAKLFLCFIQGFLEIMGEIAFGLSLAGIPLRWGRIAVAGSLLTAAVLFIRSFNFTFGLHTLLCIVLMALFYAYTTYLPPSTSLVISFCSVAALATLELAVHGLFFSLTKLPLDYVLANNFLWILLGIPQALILIALSLLISKFKKKRERGWKLKPFRYRGEKGGS